MTNKNLFNNLNTVIDKEFEHNLTQQLYVSIASWNAVLNAKTEIKQLIDVAYSKVDSEKASIGLATAIIEIYDQLDVKPSQNSKLILKKNLIKNFKFLPR